MRGCLTFLLAVSGTLFGSATPQRWDDATHGRNAVPDYPRVFAQDSVKRLDIQVTSEDWDALMADMSSMAGEFGAGGGVGPQMMPVPTDNLAPCVDRVEGDMCMVGNPPAGGRCTQVPMGGALMCFPLANAGPRGGGQAPNAGQMPGGQGFGGGGARDDVEFLPRTPIYIQANITFDGVRFEHVGLRLKGNSSLLNSWRSGIDKLPLRLNFDEFEDVHPEIDGQTFFGFPNLSLTNNSQDSSFLRAKVAGDLFREGGVPTARTAFMRVYMDRGEGPIYLGLYTVVEVPDKPMLNTYFGSDDGNLYKPVGTGARWTSFDSESFPKKTNAELEDWTDVEDAIAVLNESRVDAARWKRRLQARFDVSGFLQWLAVNTVIGNTDTYGGFSPHNYYLYGSPRHRDRLFWIPWDHDLSFSASMGAGNFGMGGGGGLAEPDVFHDQVNNQWPLIRYLLDDPSYRAEYRTRIETVLATVFEPTTLTARLQREYTLIAPYVVGPEGERQGHTFLNNSTAFEQSVYGPNGLLAYIQSRHTSIRNQLLVLP